MLCCATLWCAVLTCLTFNPAGLLQEKNTLILGNPLSVLSACLFMDLSLSVSLFMSLCLSPCLGNCVGFISLFLLIFLCPSVCIHLSTCVCVPATLSSSCYSCMHSKIYAILQNPTSSSSHLYSYCSSDLTLSASFQINHHSLREFFLLTFTRSFIHSLLISLISVSPPFILSSLPLSLFSFLLSFLTSCSMINFLASFLSCLSSCYLGILLLNCFSFRH